MTKTIKILMVDDHPIIIEGYQNTLMATKREDQILTVDTANDCDTADMLMRRAAREKHYDVLFFDIRIPPCKDGRMSSGEDLAKLAKQLMPDAKIVILTMFNESYRIHNIIKNISPDGFLIKSDLTSSELAEAFQHILVSPPYYSSTVNQFLNKLIVNEIYIDETNRKILYLLSQGMKTRSLPEHIDASMSSIEKRKKQLKELFHVNDGKDETLISEARSKGFI